MKRFFSKGFIVSISVYIVVYYVQLICGWSSLDTMTSISALASLIFVTGFIPLSKMSVPLILIALSGVIGFFGLEGEWFSTIWYGFREMETLITLLIVIPMVSWVLEEEPYVEHLMYTARKWLFSSYRFFSGSVLLGQIISYFLTVGSIPMNYHILNTFLKSYRHDVWETFKSRMAIRGFAFSTMWVFSIPSFAYAVQSLKASLIITILQGFFISLLGLALSLIGVRMMEKKQGHMFTKGIQEQLLRVESEHSDGFNAHGKVIEFMVLFITLVGSILFVHSIFNIDILQVISPVVFLWTFSYFIMKRKIRRFWQIGYSYVSSNMSLRAPEVIIMIAAGTLIYGLDASNWGQNAVHWVYQITSEVKGLNFLWFTPFFVLLMGYAGLGMAVGMVLIGGILQSIYLPYSPELIVLSLTIGSVMAAVTSPFMVPVILLSGQNGRSVFVNGFRSNWLFAITFYIVGQIYIQSMILLGH